MKFEIDSPKNNLKNVMHAFFLGLAIAIAEPSTVLPLMLSHFTQNSIVIGLYASLLKGGAIVIQLYAAFHAQAYKRVIPYLRKVFFARFISWFLIGFSIFAIGESNKTLTLILIGVGLFFFSFSAGFGAIYFKELQAKLFSKKFRGKTMSYRQTAKAIATIISGAVTGFVISSFEAPLNYAYLFMVSSFLLGIGFVAFGTVDEPIKENIAKKEKSFREFIKNSSKILKEDIRLKYQIIAIFLSYGQFLSLPFVILNAHKTIELTGWLIGGFITIQMIGSIIGNVFLWRKIYNYEKMLLLSFVIMIGAFFIALFAKTAFLFALFFLLFGISLDGFSNSGMNLVIEIAPEEKRPIYTALQTNLTSFGLFLPIIGGALLKFVGSYEFIYIVSILLLSIGFIVSFKLISLKDTFNTIDLSS